MMLANLYSRLRAKSIHHRLACTTTRKHNHIQVTNERYVKRSLHNEVDTPNYTRIRQYTSTNVAEMGSNDVNLKTKVNSKIKVVVGMSGGVDSSVVALLLKQQGYDVEGLFMQNWDTRDEQGHCSADEDYKDMLDVCQKLGIKGHRVSFVKEYWNDVFEGFLQSYEKGHTPNPDIFCNKEIKFKAFLKHATDNLGADMIATGHYAQRVPTPGGDGWQLAMGLDQGKDQSYFLSAINRACLDKVLFPVGHILKPKVRELAAAAGLSVATKRDSTGICFVGKRHFPEFISNYIAPTPGPITELESGREIGKHTGIHTRTLGERSRISGCPESYYVVEKNVKGNELIVARGHDHSALYRKWLTCSTFYWMGSGKEMPHTTRCQVRARYQQRLAWATVTRTKSSIHASGSNEPCIQPHPLQADRDNVIPADIHPYIPEKGSQSATSGSASDMGVSVQCVFDNPHYCVTPGQMLVAYDGVVCLGGGVIDGFGPTMYTTQRNIKDGMVGVGRVTQDDMTPGSESD